MKLLYTVLAIAFFHTLAVSQNTLNDLNFTCEVKSERRNGVAIYAKIDGQSYRIESFGNSELISHHTNDDILSVALKECYYDVVAEVIVLFYKYDPAEETWTRFYHESVPIHYPDAKQRCTSSVIEFSSDNTLTLRSSSEKHEDMVYRYDLKNAMRFDLTHYDNKKIKLTAGKTLFKHGKVYFMNGKYYSWDKE